MVWTVKKNFFFLNELLFDPETLWCVCAGSTSSASPPSWCAEPTARSTQRWAARLMATKTRSSWFRGRPSRSRPCCPERLRVRLPLWTVYSRDPQMVYWIMTGKYGRGAFDLWSLRGTGCRLWGLLTEIHSLSSTLLHLFCVVLFYSEVQLNTITPN